VRSQAQLARAVLAERGYVVQKIGQELMVAKVRACSDQPAGAAVHEEKVSTVAGCKNMPLPSIVPP
jgi:hypothetical protein